MKLTYLDAGVLIAAARGTDRIARRAFEILDDSERQFVAGAFLQLEVMPKAVFNKQAEEVRFYEEFFEIVDSWVEISDDMVHTAFEEACRSGLSALDALHVASASTLGADELITTEKETKPLNRTTLVKVISIAS